ncbi:aldo/keto reductase family oxidoreductase [Croceivirga sp. JEA036]|uniref:aldo/keto reductase n=1 Tax=Croceivirga sp. JEA036 TaxID=2721162 RepID=UPI00143C5A52|nr:aldo/keto reductase [Croceivirga sp. JEA036]NJB36481.1 hypothetical protein [Croceivirga sp. JEA036]
MKNYPISSIIVGTMRLGQWGQKMATKEMDSFIKECLEIDLVDFDHADIYGSYTTEAEFGKVLKQNSALRGQLRLTTKCGIKLVSEHRSEHKVKSYDLSKAHIIASVETSLKNLNTDYLDTLLLHRPDYLMEPEEIAEAFTDLSKSGKVRFFGVSNFTKEQFESLNTLTPLCTNQIEVSLLQREAFSNGSLTQAMQMGFRPTAWSPLGGGALFAKEVPFALKPLKNTLNQLCTNYNCSIDQLLLAWLAKHPSSIVPVMGTRKIARLQKAKEAMDLNITKEDWYVLWQAATGKEID